MLAFRQSLPTLCTALVKRCGVTNNAKIQSVSALLPLRKQHNAPFRRFASTTPPPPSTPKPPPSGPKAKPPNPQNQLPVVLALAALSAGGYYYYQSIFLKESSGVTVPAPGGPVKHLPPSTQARKLEYNEVYKELAKIMDEDPDYDDGSFGPILVRLAWHASGTFDKSSNTGGSNKATMRFSAESEHGGNAGLGVARTKLEKIKQIFPDISYGDLWTLAGVAAIQEMGGPIVPWRPGRVDGFERDQTPDGRLPDGSKDAKHVRSIFYRMGFNDQEIVALSGAHALGRCHTDRSGFDGPWTPSPTMVTNDYFKQLLDNKWVVKKWNGPRQFVDESTGELMMLPTDMALISDKKFKPWVEQYAKDEKKFFNDFSAVLVKLFELGVPFKEPAERVTFKPINV